MLPTLAVMKFGFFLRWIGNTAFFFIFFCRNFHTMQFSNIANPEINVEKPKTTALVVATWTNLIFILLIIATFSGIFVVGLFWILLNKIIKESWNCIVLPYTRNVKVLAEKWILLILNTNVILYSEKCQWNTIRPISRCEKWHIYRNHWRSEWKWLSSI